MKRNAKFLQDNPAMRSSEIAAAASLTSHLSSIEKTMSNAEAHWNAGQNQQAEILCQQILSQAPNSPPALHLLGLIAHTVGKLQEAIELIRAACSSPQAPETYYSNLAELCRQAGQWDLAERAGRKARSWKCERT